MKKIFLIVAIVDSLFKQHVCKPFRKIFFPDLLISTIVLCTSGRILFLFFESSLFGSAGKQAGSFYKVKTAFNY